MTLYRNENSCLVKYIIVSLALASAITANCRRIPEDLESQIFKKYVIKPIPESVTDIKMDKLSPGGLFASGLKYVMHFKISKKDVALILKSRAFKEYEWITYKKGTPWDELCWGNKLKVNHQEHKISGTNSHEMIVYKDSEQPPEWFRPNDWDKPKVYSISEKWGRSRRYRTNVLIFNEDLEEAYFFENVPGH
ncbi:MAG: hypothetical protein JW837_01955 [Sedimentisphaerales bacterium]|nr:hypothetical protein [Sedimentisphaerales bacterium]